MFHTEPQEHLHGREIAWPAGNVMGGSSSINGMVYVRGNRCDFQAWEAAGATGWGHENVLPYLKSAENRARGGDAYHGADGPMTVSGPTDHTPLFDAFVHAGRQAGYEVTDDFNGARQEGFGRTT